MIQRNQILLYYHDFTAVFVNMSKKCKHGGFLQSQSHMQACACAYMARTQTKDLRYKSIWQSINTVIEYCIMMRCFMSIEMVICMFQKIAAHDLTFL